MMTKKPSAVGLLAVVFICCLFAYQSQSVAKAQDILRQRSPKQQQQQQQQTNSQSNPLANIQLPPELASLSPQQLHQLAQLRELQIQQQTAQQQQQQQANSNQGAPAPIGAEALSTTQPSSAQIPQPNSAQPAAPSTPADGNERHDDGAYNESGSEMEGVVQPGGEGVTTAAATATGSGGGQTGTNNAAAQAAPTFEVNWNKCPQLEPSESEKSKKTQVITKCLQSAPIPTNLTRENVETHREQIATCALRVEGWFDEQGLYKYDKAESEIRGKKLDQAIELQVLKFHVACKDEASKKFPREQNKLIDQVQFYQACMDYYISIVCEIEVSVDQ